MTTENSNIVEFTITDSDIGKVIATSINNEQSRVSANNSNNKESTTDSAHEHVQFNGYERVLCPGTSDGRAMYDFLVTDDDTYAYRMSSKNHSNTGKIQIYSLQ